MPLFHMLSRERRTVGRYSVSYCIAFTGQDNGFNYPHKGIRGNYKPHETICFNTQTNHKPEAILQTTKLNFRTLNALNLHTRNIQSIANTVE